jgi:hypothetical protein
MEDSDAVDGLRIELFRKDDHGPSCGPVVGLVWHDPDRRPEVIMIGGWDGMLLRWIDGQRQPANQDIA